jgi:LDH2 family malate/lactate/ureidoglycolate dehydrogenase
MGSDWQMTAPASTSHRFEDVARDLRATAEAQSVSYAALQATIADLFRTCGLSDEDAAIAAEVALYPQLCGSDSHGAVTMPLYVTGLLDRTIKPRPNVRSERNGTCTLLIEADHGLGLVESRKAMDAVLDIAAENGLGAAAVRNSSHFGAAGYYGERAAAHGMIGIALSNASPAIAPTGGVTAILGTNPIGAGVPLPDGPPMVLDMATAMVARSRIRQMLASGETEIPADWALDPEGRPTTDPQKAIAGSVLPIGGPKGYGLALLVELLCSALSDGSPGDEITYENVVKRPSGISHFFLAIDPRGFAGADAFGRRADRLAKTIAGSAATAGGPAPRLPGGRAQAAKAERLRTGIPIAPNLAAALKQTAGILERHPAATAAAT